MIVNKQKTNFIDKIIFILLFAYFLFKPFYFWKSGLPQISDFLIVILLFVYLFKTKLNIKTSKKYNNLFIYGLIFVFYLFFVNSIWAILVGTDYKFLLTSSFYIFNFILFGMIILLYDIYNEKILKITFYGVLFSLIISFFQIFISQIAGSREVGTFNNPNQLGYYAISSFTILIIMARTKLFKNRHILIGYVISFYLSSLSLSRAAIISSYILVIIALLFFVNKGNYKTFFTRLIPILVIVLAFYMINKNYNVLANIEIYQKVIRRFETKGVISENIVDIRGYNRILDFPNKIIFGAGEIELTRFDSDGKELHSTFGNIIFSYGIFGLFLYLTFIIKSVRKDWMTNILILIPIFLYGLSHNGIRNGLYWIIFALLFVINLNEKDVLKNELQL